MIVAQRRQRPVGYASDPYRLMADRRHVIDDAYLFNVFNVHNLSVIRVWYGFILIYRRTKLNRCVDAEIIAVGIEFVVLDDGSAADEKLNLVDDGVSATGVSDLLVTFLDGFGQLLIAHGFLVTEGNL